MKNFQNIFLFTIGASELKFYSISYSLAISVDHIWLTKTMKELDYPPNFWGRVYWDFLDFPKKIWGLGAPSPMGPGTPK